MNGSYRTRGRHLAPDIAHDAFDRDDVVYIEQQPRQHRALARLTDRDRTGVVGDLERTEQAKAQTASLALGRRRQKWKSARPIGGRIPPIGYALAMRVGVT